MTESLLGPVIEWIINLVSTFGYLGIFIAMVIESASIPLPSEIIMGIAGYLVFEGKMDLLTAGTIGALGNITGSTIMYWLGSKGGHPIVRKYGKYLHFNEDKFDKVNNWFDKWGDKVVFISQLLPIVRTYVSLPAGILKISYPKFIFYTFTGAWIWCTGLAYVSSLFGEEWRHIEDYIKPFEYVMIVGAIFGIATYFLYKAYKNRQHKIEVEFSKDS